MTILYEYRRQVRRGSQPVSLITKDSLLSERGFRSIYGFDEDACEYIRNENTTAGLAGHNFYSDDLLVDFDNAWAAAEAFAEDMAPYSYTMWDTGGRSIHFHVDIEPMYGPEVPAVQRAWMKELYPEADTGIYKSSGIYRLPGTYHHRAVGARKALLEENRGDKLYIGDVRRPVDVQRAVYSGGHELEDALNHMLMLPAGEGGRNNRLFNIVRLCKLCGEDLEATKRLCAGWNAQFCSPPLPHQELMQTVLSGFHSRLEA